MSGSIGFTSQGKVKWRPRTDVLPKARICSQTEVILLLGRKVFDDVIAAGWLKPCVERPNARDNATKIYAIAEVDAVGLRIAKGEYPSITPKAARAA